MPGYLLDEDSIARLAKMLRDYEQGGLRDLMPEMRSEYGTVPVINYARCTSSTATSGTYPGQLVSYDSILATYTDTLAIRLIDINGGTLTNNTRYLARYAGRTSGGDPLYVTDSSSGGAILSIDVVTSISCVDGAITPVWTTICIPGGYVCNTTTTTTTAEPTTTTTTTAGG